VSTRYCPECGHNHPSDARFCMQCGCMLPDAAGQRSAPVPAPESAPAPQGQGINFAGIATGFLAYLGLRHASRKARQAAFLVIFFMLFFGCPMMCGFVAFVMEWFAALFR
jgi:hypothetical protein